MNLGVYIPHFTKNEAVIDMSKMLNAAVKEDKVSDACVFYDSIGPTHLQMEYALFNSADLWNFTGNLVTTTVETTSKALNVGNKFSIFFYYGFEGDKDVLGLITISNNPNVEVICRSEEDKQEFFRLTGKEPKRVVDNFNIDILEAIQ